METSGRSSECACLRAKDRERVWGALVGLPFGKVTVSSLLNTCHFINARAWHEYILVFTEVRGRERVRAFSRCCVCAHICHRLTEHTEGDVWRRIDGRVGPRHHASALVGGGRSAERGHSALSCGTHTQCRCVQGRWLPGLSGEGGEPLVSGSRGQWAPEGALSEGAAGPAPWLALRLARGARGTAARRLTAGSL